MSEIGNLLKHAAVSVKSLGKSQLSAVLKDRDEYGLKDFGGSGGCSVRVKVVDGPGEAVVLAARNLLLAGGP